MPTDLPAWQKIAARITHYFLYLFMFLMPISGILMSILAGYNVNVFNLFVIPASEKNLELAKLFYQIHITAIWGFVILIALHICAALFHHFIRKDNVFIRMVR